MLNRALLIDAKWRFIQHLGDLRNLCGPQQEEGTQRSPSHGRPAGAHLWRGSSASRSPSPSRLKDSTSRKIDTPGQIAIQGAWST
jgi:hypothetical protein